MADGERLIWVDMETSGLDPREELPLEIGFVITDLSLDVIDKWDCAIWDSPRYDDRIFDDFILNMHGPEGSGLLEYAQGYGATPKAAFAEALEWLDGHGVRPDKRIGTEPIVGSSVQFDREWLYVWAPRIHDSFHYRNIDFSTVKELCRRYNPQVYSQIEKHTIKRQVHRCLPDIEDSISEARFYLENFIHVSIDW